MARTLARLRMNLDFMPSPLADRPGLLIRDPYHYSDATLVIPPALVGCLELFDGQRGELDLREMLVRLTGDLQVGEIAGHLENTLHEAGFLEDEAYQEMREARQREFAAAPSRAASHAGSAYPAEAGALAATIEGYMGAGTPAGAPDGELIGVAAPHVSPEGGWRMYQAAYRALAPALDDRVFVILGTSHYGEPERFGLTRKEFATPFGAAVTDTALVDRLAAEAGDAVLMEDYCHAVEHSIEFQVVFLQYLYGPGIRILPVLCGPFAHSINEGGRPERDEGVRRFLGALGEMAERERSRLFWVLGIDLAHMGRRYGDQFEAQADEGRMRAVAERDSRRIARVNSCDAEGFWDLVQENGDDLKWCGAAPLYTFLRAVPGAGGRLLGYEQWNIDDASVVSFAALALERSQPSIPTI